MSIPVDVVVNNAMERSRELVNLLPALSLPETAGETYGMIRAQLESKGEMIGNNDPWIAAHAVAARLTLVTNNLVTRAYSSSHQPSDSCSITSF